MIKDMISHSIAHISDESKKVHVIFFVQNISFSANFSHILLNSEHIRKNNLDSKDSLKLHRDIFFNDEKLDIICQKIKQFDAYNFVKYISSRKRSNRFPATIMKCEFKRTQSMLAQFKSLASIKRQFARKEISKLDRKLVKSETLFEIQTCSFSIFSTGLVNASGATCKEDAKRILCVLRLLNSFLPSST